MSELTAAFGAYHALLVSPISDSRSDDLKSNSARRYRFKIRNTDGKSRVIRDAKK
jgi:hypothetical protein